MYILGRFRRLKYIEAHTAQTASYYIGAAGVLHNICIIQEDIDEYFDSDDDDDNNPGQGVLLPAGIFARDNRARGVFRRDAIMQHI